MTWEEVPTPNLSPQAGVTIYPGARATNPNVWYGQDDLITVPTQYPRFMTPWNEVQLSNGYDGTNFGARDTSPQASYLAEVAAFQPGQTRLYGSNLADYPQQGMSPQQWQAYVQSTAGMQPQFTGGPGSITGNGIYNPGSGA